MQRLAMILLTIATILNSLCISIYMDREKPKLYGEYTTAPMKQEILIRGKDFKPYDIPLSVDLQEFTYALCMAYDINPSFVLAIMEQESGFDVNAYSNGNYGLLQINEANQRMLRQKLGITDLSDPYNNIRAGVFMLHKLFEKYGDKQKVLMAYNLGEGGAKVLWDRGIFSTGHSNSILDKQGKYQSISKER